MKRILTLLAIAASCWLLAPCAGAQNTVFKKYADRNDVDYVCITRTMLRLMGAAGGKEVNVNGVNIKGLTRNLNNILIIDADAPAAAEQMRADYAALRSNTDYEVLMETRSGGETVVTLLNSKANPAEFIMYVQDGSDDATFIVMTGKFTEEEIGLLVNGGK